MKASPLLSTDSGFRIRGNGRGYPHACLALCLTLICATVVVAQPSQLVIDCEWADTVAGPWTKLPADQTSILPNGSLLTLAKGPNKFFRLVIHEASAADIESPAVTVVEAFDPAYRSGLLTWLESLRRENKNLRVTHAEQLRNLKQDLEAAKEQLARLAVQDYEGLLRAAAIANANAASGAWSDAAAGYTQVMRESGPFWGLLFERDIIAQKMGVSFLMAGQYDIYAELCRELLRVGPRYDSMNQERISSVCLSKPQCLTPDLQDASIKLAAQACQIPNAQSNPWLMLIRGMAELREGKHRAAVATFDLAKWHNDPVARARALTYQAKAYQQLGLFNEAGVTEAEARKMFERGARTAGWWNVGFYKIARAELDSVLTAER